METRILMASVPLFPIPSLPLPGGPQSFVVGDFNGDHKPDVVVASESSDSATPPNYDDHLLFFAGKGDGTFASPVEVPITVRPGTLLAADFNGDGKLDLALTSNDDTHQAVIYLGDGGGSFAAPVPYNMGDHDAQSAAAADINGDGDIDLILATRTGAGAAAVGAVSVLLNDGDGTFAAPLVQPVGTQAGGDFQSVAVGDVNGDGKADAVIACSEENALAVMPGNNDGTFGPESEIPVGNQPWSVVVTDLNGDGRMDILSADDGVSVLLAKPGGTFAPRRTLATDGLSLQVLTVDVNGDRKPDIVVSDTSGNASVFVNTGRGTFGSRQDYYFAGDYPRIAAADVNGDGRQDLVASGSNDAVCIVLGRAHGKFASLGGVGTTASSSSSTLWAVKHNGTRRMDLLTTNDDGTVSLLEGNGKGAFHKAKTYPVYAPLTDNSLFLVRTGDFNRDGQIEIVTAYGGDIAILLPRNGTRFRRVVHYAIPGATIVDMSVADVNGDGKLDLVALGGGQGNPGTIYVLLGDGKGGFSAPEDYATGVGADSLAVADVNGDKKPDLVTADFDDGTISVFAGDGKGNFAPRQTYATGDHPVSVISMDVNRDKKMDLVASNDNGTLSFFTNQGGGALVRSDVACGRSGTLLASDVNGDKRPDLIVGGAAVLLQKKDHTFESPRFYNFGSASNVVAADLDRDRRPEIVTLTDNDAIAIGWNQQAGWHKPPTKTQLSPAQFARKYWYLR